MRAILMHVVWMDVLWKYFFQIPCIRFWCHLGSSWVFTVSTMTFKLIHYFQNQCLWSVLNFVSRNYFWLPCAYGVGISLPKSRLSQILIIASWISILMLALCSKICMKFSEIVLKKNDNLWLSSQHLSNAVPNHRSWLAACQGLITLSL